MKCMVTQVLAVSSLIITGVLLASCSNQKSAPTSKNTANTSHNQVSNKDIGFTQKSSVQCDNSSQKITLENGNFSQAGFVSGYNYCEYNLAAKAGQKISANVSAKNLDGDFGENLGLQVIVFAPEFHDFYSSDYKVNIDGEITIRVLLTRNAARKHQNDAVPFKLNISTKHQR